MKTAGILLTICLLLSLYQEKATLDIEISGFRNTKGVVLISLYTSEDQYPYEPYKSYTVTKDSIVNGKVHTTLPGLNPGQYGLCFLDDENGSGQMDNNLLGMPKEGYGFSNNVKPFLKRPEYESILFQLNPGITHLQLIVRY